MTAEVPAGPDPLVVELRQARQALRMTAAAAARALGISRNTLVSWESGRRRPSIDDVRAYAVLVGRIL